MSSSILWEPAGELLVVHGVQPRLESWMAKGHRDQLRLRESLDEFEHRLGQLPDGDLYLDLTVSIPNDYWFLNGHDLDNYLKPLLQRLGQHRFVLAKARKGQFAESRLDIGNVRNSTTHLTPLISVDCDKRFETFSWKERLRSRVLEIIDSAFERELRIGLVVALTCPPIVRWHRVWKPTIDALGPILGCQENKPFQVFDGRILEADFHVIRNTECDGISVRVWCTVLEDQSGLTPA